MDNVKMDLAMIGWGGIDWIGLSGWRQVESSCQCNNDPSGSIKCWEVIERLHNRWPISSIELVSWLAG
jgi:hypothetical protein